MKQPDGRYVHRHLCRCCNQPYGPEHADYLCAKVDYHFDAQDHVDGWNPACIEAKWIKETQLKIETS